MNFNINDKVQVQLTPYGRSVLDYQHHKFCQASGKFIPYTPPKEDANGWSDWQLWELMQKLGPYMQNGFENTIQTTIRMPSPAQETSAALLAGAIARMQLAGEQGIDSNASWRSVATNYTEKFISDHRAALQKAFSDGEARYCARYQSK